MIKYVAYIRVSTKKQGRSGLGLEAQQEIIRINAAGGEIIAWFKEVKSGKNVSVLPELDKAKQMAKEHGAVLIMAKTDRLRQTQQALDLVDELTPAGVHFCDVGKNADKFMLTLFFAFAERERLEISIRTKAALGVLKKRGVPLGRAAHKVKENPNRAIVEAGAIAMRNKALNDRNNVVSANKAIALQSKGLTYEEIAHRLNESGCRTMTGSQWHGGTVYRLLKRNFASA